MSVIDRERTVVVNRKFFDELMQDRKISLRSIARHMDISPSQLSRTMTGHRRMQLGEAASIANLLGVSVVDVMINAGIESVRDGQRYAPIIGHLTGDYTISEPDKGVKDRVPLPQCVPEDTEAIQARTAATPLSYLDGWIYFVGPPMRPAEAIGSYCVVTMDDSTKTIGTVQRGYQPGSYNIKAASGLFIQNVKIKHARRIYFTQHI